MFKFLFGLIFFFVLLVLLAGALGIGFLRSVVANNRRIVRMIQSEPLQILIKIRFSAITRENMWIMKKLKPLKPLKRTLKRMKKSNHKNI